MALEYEIIIQNQIDHENLFVVIDNIIYNLHKKSDVESLLDDVYAIGMSEGYSECYYDFCDWE